MKRFILRIGTTLALIVTLFLATMGIASAKTLSPTHADRPTVSYDCKANRCLDEVVWSGGAVHGAIGTITVQNPGLTCSGSPGDLYYRDLYLPHNGTGDIDV